MEDNKIIQLYFARSETAIQETDAKYGGYCYSIAYHILTNREDAEECVSDTYWQAWNTIPPNRPNLLAAFLGKITAVLPSTVGENSVQASGEAENLNWRWTN